jgi:hypothetical protein
MGFLNEFNSVTDSSVVIAIGVVALSIPGTALLMIYGLDFFESIDIFKILLISFGFGIASTLPSFLSLLVTKVSNTTESSDLKGIGIGYIILSSSIVAIVSNILLLVFWIASFNLQSYLITHFVIMVILLPAALTYATKSARTKNVT